MLDSRTIKKRERESCDMGRLFKTSFSSSALLLSHACVSVRECVYIAYTYARQCRGCIYEYVCVGAVYTYIHSRVGIYARTLEYVCVYS